MVGPGSERLLFAEGAAGRLGALLDGLGAGAVFLVLDDMAYERSGARPAVQAALAGRRSAVLDGFAPNPRLEDVVRGAALFRAFGPDAVVAVGGGTAIDLAKLVGTLAGHEDDLHALATGAVPVSRDGPPLIAMPTTAGTGSEATHFAVVYVEGVKHSVAHAGLRPDHVILDPLLTHAMPARLTAATGLDALSQGVESLWAVGATEGSMVHAARAVELAAGALERAVLAPDAAARRAMAEAAHASGLAIDISKTTAPHAVSYAISTGFGVPHGMAVALTLGAFLVDNAGVGPQDCADPRGAAHVRARIARICGLLGAETPEAARQRLSGLLARIGAPVRLGKVGIAAADLPGLARQVNAERLSNNPRRMTGERLVGLLSSLL
jgi:alcohol dehydrogenase class IV